MTTPKAAPEIFQLPIAELDPAIVPTGAAPGTPEFEQAVILHYAMKYADKGWQALVTLKPKGHSKKKRTFGPVELKFMDGVEGRFVGLLPQTGPATLH